MSKASEVSENGGLGPAMVAWKSAERIVTAGVQHCRVSTKKAIADSLVVKAVYHHQIRKTLLRAAGDVNRYGKTMLLSQLPFANSYSSSPCQRTRS